jgi:Ca2+-binding RTX toxin-like protein
MMAKVPRRRWFLAAPAALALAIAAGASAADWQNYGGDTGRSGNQAVGDGGPPVRALYSRADAGDRGVVSSIVATTGAVGTQRFAYATANGRVHLRVLESGAPVGPDAGVDIDDGGADSDVFGPGPGAPAAASVSPVDTSTPGRLGQLLIVHNDDDESATGDISIAQVDASGGGLVRQVPVEGTEGFSIRSSPVVTPADAAGQRVLFFVAENGDNERLFRVPVANAAAPGATFGTATATEDVNANPVASPTVLWLRNPAGAPMPYVAVGSGAPDSTLKTFAVADLTAGPVSGDLGDEVQTASVPVQPDGAPPNPGGAVKSAPVVYVAARSGDATLVHRLVQNGNAQALATAASSPALAGAPAPALATDVESASAGPTPGRVAVTTGQNLYLLDGSSMAHAASFSAAALNPGTTGFSQTTAALSGGLAYATTDDGRQLVLKLSDAQPLPADGFSENPVNGGARAARSALGQPAVARSFIAFGGGKGVFVYVNRCGNAVAGTEGADRIIGTAAGAQVLALGGSDRVSAAGSDDCVFGGAGNDALSGNSGDDRVSAGADGDRVYGRTGDDAVSGNSGDDRVDGGAGKDTVFGRRDQDHVRGGSEEDVVRGGFGDDRVLGGGGADALSGNPGDDRVSAGAGDDRVFGRSGEDGASGNAGNDRVSAGTGDDRAYGRSGDDGVSGNAGDDRVDGGTGRDRLFGRGGDDLIDARDTERDVVYCGTGRDTVRADRRDLLRGCERVFRR